MSPEEFSAVIGNKSVFSPDDLLQKYQNDDNLMVIQLLYGGYFGCGNNVNMDWLDKHGMWSRKGDYPANVHLSPSQCIDIWTEGGIDVDNVLGKR